jgi:hypothetical protein
VNAQNPSGEELEAALAAGQGTAVIDRLCEACVDLLEVDGAAVSVVQKGTSRGTFGSSGALSRQLDEFQFTYGEGPCLDAVSHGRPVLVSDLGHVAELRWPAYSLAVLDVGVRGVFALPVAIARTHIGVLDLFRHKPGPLSEQNLKAGLLAARLVAAPLLDLLTDHLDEATAAATGVSASQAALQRVEVYQATGMIMEYLKVSDDDALARLRAHAFATGQTASEVAWAVVERRITLDADEWSASPDRPGGS